MNSNRSFFKKFFLPHGITQKDANQNIAVVILGGGEGTRLSPLTKNRCKPAMEFGGRYTLIDVPISHALNAGLSPIFIIGQYLSHTLEEHLKKTYFAQGIPNKQIKLLVPKKKKGKKDYYHGTADAIRKNIQYLDCPDVEYVLVLSGDQLYNINFQEVIDFAKQTDAGMVIVSQPVSEGDASRMGVVAIKEESGQIHDFYEKPTQKPILDKFRCDGKNNCSSEKPFLGSLGIYLFKKEVICSLLAEDQRDDFGKHLIQTQIKKKNVFAFIHQGYWADLGTIESYYTANMALTCSPVNVLPGFSCYDEQSIIFSKHHHLPGAVISSAKINNSLLCEGSIIESAEVSNSIMGVRSLVRENSLIKDSLVLGNGSYASYPKNSSLGIGRDCRIEKAIIDENVSIGNGVHLMNYQGYQEYDCPNGYLVVRDGIVVVPQGTTIPNNYVF